MDNPVSLALTALALEVSHKIASLPTPDYSFLEQLLTTPFDYTNNTNNILFSELFTKVKNALLEDQDLNSLLPRDGSCGPMIFSIRNRGSANLDGIVTGLLQNAYKQVLLKNASYLEDVFTRNVLEGYQELIRTARGEKTLITCVYKLVGINLEKSLWITTPWGFIRGIQAKPQVTNMELTPTQPSAILVTSIQVQAQILRDYSAQPKINLADIELIKRNHILTSLVFAMTLSEQKPYAPLVTSGSILIPFSGGEITETYLTTNSILSEVVVEETQVKAIEDTANILYNNYSHRIKVASTRIISAISQRLDKSDSLIDAIIAWENLVGTSTETVFRVTAALTNLLELDKDKRLDFRKKLKDIYNVRSRIVHGDSVDVKKIVKASDDAINIALQAITELCKRKGDWLSIKSEELSERLILESQ